MISDLIKSIHIRKAIKEIDKSGVPSRRESTGYDLLFNGRRYPPKYTISLAHKFQKGTELPPSEFSGGTETNNYIIARGFNIQNKHRKRVALEPVQEDDEEGFPEGRKKYTQHRARERNPQIAKKAKALRLSKTGDLRCDSCEFSFGRVYGPRGKGFIEAHHTIPISKLRNNSKTYLKDIALVCSNCHRMLHRRRPWLSMKELGNILKY